MSAKQHESSIIRQARIFRAPDSWDFALVSSGENMLSIIYDCRVLFKAPVIFPIDPVKRTLGWLGQFHFKIHCNVSAWHSCLVYAGSHQ